MEFELNVRAALKAADLLEQCSGDLVFIRAAADIRDQLDRAYWDRIQQNPYLLSLLCVCKPTGFRSMMEYFSLDRRLELLLLTDSQIEIYFWRNLPDGLVAICAGHDYAPKVRLIREVMPVPDSPGYFVAPYISGQGYAFGKLQRATQWQSTVAITEPGHLLIIGQGPDGSYCSLTQQQVQSILSWWKEDDYAER